MELIARADPPRVIDSSDSRARDEDTRGVYYAKFTLERRV